MVTEMTAAIREVPSLAVGMTRVAPSPALVLTPIDVERSRRSWRTAAAGAIAGVALMVGGFALQGPLPPVPSVLEPLDMGVAPIPPTAAPAERVTLAEAPPGVGWTLPQPAGDGKGMWSRAVDEAVTVASTTPAETSMPGAPAPSSSPHLTAQQEAFEELSSTMLTWLDGPVSTFLSILCLILGFAAGITSQSAMPAITAIAFACFIKFMPRVLSGLLGLPLP